MCFLVASAHDPRSIWILVRTPQCRLPRKVSVPQERTDVRRPLAVRVRKRDQALCTVGASHPVASPVLAVRTLQMNSRRIHICGRMKPRCNYEVQCGLEESVNGLVW